jgi:2-C-methyl-D-erythritol 2,4-cyclodiphosphate synthase
MKAKLAEVLGVNERQINIKATTTEGLGFVGREEGIASQVIVSLQSAY